MDEIWYRNPSKSKVMGLYGGDEKTKSPRRIDKCRTLKKNDFFLSLIYGIVKRKGDFK